MTIMEKLFKIIKRRNGAVLPIVMLTFMVLMILLASVMTLFNNNLRQAKRQEEMVQAHYIALAGIDLAVAALLQEGTIGGPEDTLLYDQFGSHRPFSDTPVLQHTIYLDNDEALIRIRAIDTGERWVEIRSVGTLSATGATRIITLRFLTDNPEVQQWDTN